ncbi:MAG: endonuclease/exonuclease/phosphatase family protein [Geodermatophilaceae bacterium]|nr:endonuclease/exonuclease/phosphatase family protein [Geodermatophilaceae bacterium]
MRDRSVAIACFAALLLATAVLSTAPAASTADHSSRRGDLVTQEIRVVSQNIAGGSHGHGVSASLDHLDMQIGVTDPQVVLVVEICINQVAEFRRRHPTWDTAFTVLRDDPRTGCAGRDARGAPVVLPSGDLRLRQGEMIASPGDLERVSRTRLTPDAKDPLRDFHLTCADVVLAGGPAANALRACVTHLRSGHPDRERFPEETERRDEIRRDQVVEIARVTGPLIDYGVHVVVGGDFNAVPWDRALDHMYRLRAKSGRPNGPGDFAESDQTDGAWFNTPGGPERSVFECPVSARECRTGEPTIGSDTKKRYDYIFFSRARTFGLHGKAGGKGDPASDHSLVRGRLPCGWQADLSCQPCTLGRGKTHETSECVVRGSSALDGGVLDRRSARNLRWR